MHPWFISLNKSPPRFIKLLPLPRFLLALHVRLFSAPGVVWGHLEALRLAPIPPVSG